MLIAAALVGLFTAFYFGLRHGVTAALVALALFFAAATVPGLRLWAYAAVGVGLIAVGWLGPRRANPTHVARMTRTLRGGFRQVKKRLWDTPKKK